MNAEQHERWIVGLDLGARSYGALVFAGWMAAAPGMGARPEVRGVHVLESWAAQQLPVSMADYTAAVGRLATERARERGLELAGVEVIEAERAEQGLIAAATGADALILGRAAHRRERRWVRLGRVARRVLRALPRPVFVVPPDLSPAGLAGPIVLATDLETTGPAAVERAIGLARAHARPLVLAHVGDPRHSELLDELEPRLFAERQRHREGVALAFASWAEAHGLGAVRRALEFDAPPEGLAAIAGRERAAVVVVGSRRLGAAERVFTVSTASALAAMSATPVAIVPEPGEGSGHPFRV